MEKRLKDRPLLEECVGVLKANVFSYEEDLKINALFEKMCPLTTWGILTPIN